VQDHALPKFLQITLHDLVSQNISLAPSKESSIGTVSTDLQIRRRQKFQVKWPLSPRAEWGRGTRRRDRDGVTATASAQLTTPVVEGDRPIWAFKQGCADSGWDALGRDEISQSTEHVRR
jgi:hypothetical protein